MRILQWNSGKGNSIPSTSSSTHSKPVVRDGRTHPSTEDLHWSLLVMSNDVPWREHHIHHDGSEADEGADDFHLQLFAPPDDPFRTFEYSFPVTLVDGGGTSASSTSRSCSRGSTAPSLNTKRRTRPRRTAPITRMRRRIVAAAARRPRRRR